MWANEVAKERAYGISRCCCIGARGLSLHATLALLGLAQREDLLIEVTADSGRAVLERILATSFVGGFEAMHVERARCFASEFVSAFQQEGCKFFTNGDWAGPGAYAWGALTDAVFDGGLIAYGPNVSACLWVEEDD